MTVRGWWVGVLALMACGELEIFERRTQPEAVPPGPAPACALPDEEPAPCRSVSILTDEEGRPPVQDAFTDPPPGWSPPSVAIPFGFQTPLGCVEKPPVRDLEEACAIDTYSPDGALIAQELRSPRHVRRFEGGQLVEEIEFDAAGRVLRRGSPNWSDAWAYRDDGAIIDRRWSHEGLEERAVLSCDGRIDQLLTSRCDASPRQYHYDSAGRLVRLNQSHPGRSVHEELVYDERNRLRVHRDHFGDMRFWDGAGRLIRNDFGASGSTSGTEHHLYGPDGLVRTYYAADGTAHYTATTEYQYDAGRVSLWWKVHDSISPIAGRNHTRTESHRLSYSCEGGKVMEEIDHDLDGVADVVIRWLPRADGTVHEYSSSREGPFGNRKLYRFDCE